MKYRLEGKIGMILSSNLFLCRWDEDFILFQEGNSEILETNPSK